MSLKHPPARFVAPLKSVVALPDDRFQMLLDVVDALHEPISLKRFFERLIDEVALGQGEAQWIAPLLHELGLIVEDDRRGQRACVEDLAEATALDIAESDRGQFSDRVDALLSRAPMAILHAYMAMIDSYERLYRKAWIMPEIRPMLTGDYSQATVALMTHTLRINLIHAGRVEDFYVTLDRDDLHALRDLVNQAIEADEAIAQGAAVWRDAAPVPLSDWA